MKYEKCETCGDIDYGKWGTLGVIGYSLFVGSMAYVLSQVFYSKEYALILMIFGVILWLPMYVITLQEIRKERRMRNNDTE